jgi:hypothetical protein
MSVNSTVAVSVPAAPEVTGPAYGGWGRALSHPGGSIEHDFLLQQTTAGAKMAISEEARHDLYQGLEKLLGRERATTLMEHLPPVGWADVATKRDLDLRLEATEARLTALIDRRFSEAVRVQVFTTLGSVMAAVTLAFAAARL